MTNIGTISKRVNSQKYQVLISPSGTPTDDFVLLQNASLSLTHSEFREPTTGGGIIYYSGLPDNVLSGTILYTSDFFENDTGGDTDDLKGLFDLTNGEYSTKALRIQLTDYSNNVTTYTFTEAKLTSCVIYKGVEGAVKADISFVLLSNPTELPA